MKTRMTMAAIVVFTACGRGEAKAFDYLCCNPLVDSNCTLQSSPCSFQSSDYAIQMKLPIDTNSADSATTSVLTTDAPWMGICPLFCSGAAPCGAAEIDINGTCCNQTPDICLDITANPNNPGPMRAVSENATFGDNLTYVAYKLCYGSPPCMPGAFQVGNSCCSDAVPSVPSTPSDPYNTNGDVIGFPGFPTCDDSNTCGNLCDTVLFNVCNEQTFGCNCTAPDTCGGGGTSGVCGCTPITACPTDACGAVSDGCGGTLQCGGCAAGFACLGGTCECQAANNCGNRLCGQVDNGCGTMLDCGHCPADQVCSSTGLSCIACHPKTCLQEGFVCGMHGDGCGQGIECGTCPAGKSCESSGRACVTPPVAP